MRLSSTCSIWPRSARTRFYRGSWTQLQGAIFAQSATEHRSKVAHDRIEIDRLGPQDLAPPEGKQLGRDRGGPLRGPSDRFDILAHGVREPDMPQDEGRRRKHYAHLIVGFVSHPSRQPPDRIHLLHLAEVLLDSAPVGHVVKGGHCGDDRPAGIADRGRVAAEEDAIAIRPDDLDLLVAYDLTLSKRPGQRPLGWSVGASVRV